MWRRQFGPDIIVQTSDDALAKALNIVFFALASPLPPAAPALILTRKNDLVSAQNFPVAHIGLDERAWPPILESWLTHHISTATRSLRGFHAGAVIRNNRTLLLPGERRSGKSTATLWLSRNGIYLGDDIVFIHPDTLAITGLPKAVTLKAGSFPLFESNGDYTDAIRGPIRYALPERVQIEAPAPSLIVFPQFEENAKTEIAKLDPPIAAFALVQQSFGHDTARLDLAAKLAQLPCYRIRYAQLEEFESAVGSLS